MGNSVGYDGGFRLLRKGDRSYCIKLGKVGIKSKERKVEYIRGTGERRETWEVSYQTHDVYEYDGLNCRFTLIMTTGRGYEALEIKVEDVTSEELYTLTDAARTSESCLLYASSKTTLSPHPCPSSTNSSSFCIGANTVRFEEVSHLKTNARDDGFAVRELDFLRPNWSGLIDSGDLSETRVYRCFYNMRIPCKTRITNPRGDVSETSVFMYGSAIRRRLMVREWITKRGDKAPFMGTVAHYYANTWGWGEDVGLSLMVRIRVTELKKLHIEVDGPLEHPASALFYMFDEVSRTLVWTPTACPHCAKTIQNKQYDHNDAHSLHNIGGKFKGNATCSYFEGSTINFN